MEVLIACLDRIPIFAGEGILCSFLEPFLTLGKALVPVRAISMDKTIDNWYFRIARRTLTFQQPWLRFGTKLETAFWCAERRRTFVGNSLARRSKSLALFALSCLSWYLRYFMFHIGYASSSQNSNHAFPLPFRSILPNSHPRPSFLNCSKLPWAFTSKSTLMAYVLLDFHQHLHHTEHFLLLYCRRMWNNCTTQENDSQAWGYCYDFITTLWNGSIVDGSTPRDGL